MEGPNRELDWQLVDEELHWHFNEVLAPMSMFLDGRVTYELMAGFWPTADHDPASPPPMADFARIWRDMPKIVFSRTLDGAGWNTTVRRDVDPDEIRALKAEAGGDMALGGADLASAFLRHDLVDELRLYVHPVVLGAGKRLFEAPSTTLPLRLVETKTFASGVVLLRYDRTR
jgi:dihydrofolate reductase